MRVAGLPLVSVNDAFVQLTGYSQNEAVGHNCRFLQGSATEDSSVAELVRSIRERTACVVKITNYRKDGVSFVNELSLHPIFDSRGIYRYVVGVASNASETSAPIERALLVALRQLIPTHFPAALNGRNERRVTSFDVLNVEFQYEEAALQLARVACCNDMRGSMDRLLQHPETSHLVLQALPENERRFRCASAALTSLQNTPSRLCR
jgi:PAS domain S-box-containing protein